MKEHERLAVEWGVPLAIAVLAVGARAAINPDRATVTSVIRAILIGLFIGVEVNLYLLTTEIPQEWRGAIVGLAAALSNELLIGAIKVGQQVAQDPASFIRWFNNRGGPRP